MTFYIAGDSVYNAANFRIAVYVDMNGYANYNDPRPIQTYGEKEDPFWSLGIDTEGWTYEEKQAEFGLLDDFRIKIDVTGVWGWDEVGSAWVDLLAAGGAAHIRLHTMTNILDHSAGNWKVFYSDGVGHVIELSLGALNTFLKSGGAGVAPTFSIIDHGVLDGLGDDDHAIYLLINGTRAMTGDLDMGTKAVTNVGNVDGVDVSVFKTTYDNHLHDGQTLQADGINSDGGVFSFTTTGGVTFNQDVTVPNLITAGNVDGVDISAISITNMPTAINTWKVLYTDGAGAVQELALGADGEVLTSTGAAGAPAFEAVGGGAVGDGLPDSSNKAWILCPYELSRYDKTQIYAYKYCNVDGTDEEMVFAIPLPYSVGSKSLYIDSVKVGVNVADGTNYITDTKMQHVKYNGMATLWSDGTDLTTSQIKTFTFTAIDLSARERVCIQLNTVVATTLNLRISYVGVQYYYA